MIGKNGVAVSFDVLGKIARDRTLRGKGRKGNNAATLLLHCVGKMESDNTIPTSRQELCRELQLNEAKLDEAFKLLREREYIIEDSNGTLKVSRNLAFLIPDEPSMNDLESLEGAQLADGRIIGSTAAV
jgi:hypothetical protein